MERVNEYMGRQCSFLHRRYLLYPSCRRKQKVKTDSTFPETFCKLPLILILILVSISATAVEDSVEFDITEENAYWSALPYLDMVTTQPRPVDREPTTTLTLGLRECVELARRQNFDLINSRRDLEIARSRWREERGSFIPFVDIIGRYSTGKDRTRGEMGERVELYNDHQEGRLEITQNLPTGGELYAFGSTQRDYAEESSLYSSSVGAGTRQPLLRGGGFAVGLANLRTAELNSLDTFISVRNDERDIAINVIRQYFRILQAKLDLQVSRDALAEKRRFLEETQMKFELDEVAQSEVSRAEILYLQEQEKYTLKEQIYRDRIEGMLILLALPLDTELLIIDVTDSLIATGLPRLAPQEEYIREGLIMRSELRQSDIALHRAKINLDVARNGLLPFLDFSAETESFESDDYFRHTRTLDQNTWTAGLDLTIPIPNIAKKESYRRTLIDMEKVKTNRESLKRDITREVKLAYRNLITNEQNIQILLKTVEQARLSLQQEKDRFEFGLNTSVDIRLAQDDLFQAQSSYYTAVLNHQILIAELYKAIGRPIF